MLTRRRFFATSVMAGVAAATVPAAARSRPVRLGVIGISFHAVAGAVVQIILERLGMEVTVQTAPHDEMFRRLGEEEVDLLIAAWMPGTHQHLFTPYADRIAPIATLYRDARLYWSVPSYVPQDLIASVADLARPDIATRMDRVIRSIGPSAGLSVRSAQMLPAYGLDKAGYRLEPGETAIWLDNFRAAHAAGRWVVMPLWQPHFLNRTHALRILADPKAIMDGADDAVIMANTAFLRALDPQHAAVLSAIDIGLDSITVQDLAVNTGGMTAAEAATQWLATQADRVAQWLAATP